MSTYGVVVTGWLAFNAGCVVLLAVDVVRNRRHEKRDRADAAKVIAELGPLNASVADIADIVELQRADDRIFQLVEEWSK